MTLIKTKIREVTDPGRVAPLTSADIRPLFNRLWDDCIKDLSDESSQDWVADIPWHLTAAEGKRVTRRAANRTVAITITR
jgi:hypothetical protein